MAYRKPGTLLPIEADVLSVIASRGPHGAHGFVVAKELASGHRAKTLVAHGTLYKALDRLARRGLLSAEWEDPDVAESAGRPRRKVYWITAAGVAVLSEATATAPGLRAGEAPA
jgi:DNA-binding PadR family transcriptional regulator